MPRGPVSRRDDRMCHNPVIHGPVFSPTEKRSLACSCRHAVPLEVLLPPSTRAAWNCCNFVADTGRKKAPFGFWGPPWRRFASISTAPLAGMRYLRFWKTGFIASGAAERPSPTAPFRSAALQRRRARRRPVRQSLTLQKSSPPGGYCGGSTAKFKPQALLVKRLTASFFN